MTISGFYCTTVDKSTPTLFSVGIWFLHKASRTTLPIGCPYLNPQNHEKPPYISRSCCGCTYANQIKDIDLSYPTAVYFTWRSGRFKLELQTGGVDMVDGQMLIGNDTSILLRRLIEISSISKILNTPKS